MAGTWTAEHEAAALRWWNAYVGGPPDWQWLKRMDSETSAFLSRSPEEVAEYWLNLPNRVRPTPPKRNRLRAFLGI